MRVYLIAGEPSGDVLGAKLIRALQRQSGTELKLYGLGGPLMASEGLKSLFPIEELSMMGLAEVLPHIPRLIRRINQTVADIHEKQPDVVVTIDSPGFNFRIAKKLQGEGIPLVHYVAPTVWAWKPKRAGKVAGLFDHLLVLLPFEPPYFEQEGLPTTFVGHPVVEDQLPADRAAFRNAHQIPAEKKILLMLPGSRKGELHRHLPVFRETAELLKQRVEKLVIAMPTLPHLAAYLRHQTQHWPVPVIVLDSETGRKQAMAAADAALAKSGTITLELGMAGVPMVVTYKVHPFSAWLMSWMLKVPYVSLINILEREEVIPELLQQQCDPALLSGKLGDLLCDANAAEEQKQRVREALHKLRPEGGRQPSELAAEVVIRCAAKSGKGTA